MEPTPLQHSGKSSYPESPTGIREEVARRLDEFTTWLQEAEKKTWYRVQRLEVLRADSLFLPHFCDKTPLGQDWREHRRLLADLHSFKKDIEQASHKHHCVFGGALDSVPEIGAPLSCNDIDQQQAGPLVTTTKLIQPADLTGLAGPAPEQQEEKKVHPQPPRIKKSSVPAPPVAMVSQNTKRKDIETTKKENESDSEDDGDYALVTSGLVDERPRKRRRARS